MSDLSIIPLKNSLAVDAKRIEVKSKIIERIRTLGLNLEQYRTSNELLLLVLNLIEYLVVKKDKIDKKALAIEIINDIFQMNNQEKQAVADNIEFLWVNKAIKKVSMWKLFCAGVKELLFKRSD